MPKLLGEEAEDVAVLTFGRSGQVAAERARAFAPGIVVSAFGRPDVDITDISLVGRAFDRVHPRVVVNAAAYTALDAAETTIEMALAVNADGATNIAQACAQRDVPLVHLSTDYVFDGKKKGPYCETDPPAPINANGRSKMAGEQFGSPTGAKSIADTIVMISRALSHDPDRGSGTYHFVDRGETTWYVIATAIFEYVAAKGFKVPCLDPTDQYPTPARWPRNSVLACDKILTEFGVIQKPWRHCLTDCLDELFANEGGWA